MNIPFANSWREQNPLCVSDAHIQFFWRVGHESLDVVLKLVFEMLKLNDRKPNWQKQTNGLLIRIGLWNFSSRWVCNKCILQIKFKSILGTGDLVSNSLSSPPNRGEFSCKSSDKIRNNIAAAVYRNCGNIQTRNSNILLTTLDRRHSTNQDARYVV